MNKRQIISIISNSLIFLLVLSSIIWIFSVTEYGEDALLINGWEMLKFFTVESNIFIGISSLLSLLFIIKGNTPNWIKIIKYVATSTVAVTFLTVMFYLGPTLGYLAMLSDANLFLHLITPVLAIVHLFFFEEKIENLKFITTIHTAIPVTIYGLVYLLNLYFHNGYGQSKYDWYYFGAFGIGYGVLIYFSMIVLSYLIGIGLYFGYKKLGNKKST